MSREHEFYIGYSKQAPPALAGFLRRWVILLLVVGAGLAALFAGVVQSRFDPGVLEYGAVRNFEGVVREGPHPVLLVEGSGSGESVASPFYLVAFGKHGAGDEVAGLDGRRARLDGSLIYRDGETMIEVVGGSVESLGSTREGAQSEFKDLGIQTLRGEIVDSKCFFGVMKPGRGKPHRACATRCISGGVPPVLRIETAEGDFEHYLVVGKSGEAVNTLVLDYIAEPLEITGRVVERDNLRYLQADPKTYRRIG